MEVRMSATARKPEDQKHLNDLFALKPSDGALIDYIQDRMEILVESGPSRHQRVEMLIEELTNIVKNTTDDLAWARQGQE
jgi:hypothetical protein